MKKESMTRRLFIILILVLGVTSSVAYGAETAAQVIRRTAELLRRAPGIKTSFRMEGAQGAMTGTLKCAGSKFVLSSPAVSTWFDGKTMYTYNPRTSETTVTIPEPSEIAESNPLAAISANQDSYTATYGKTAPKGGKQIVLTPKKRGTGMKRIEVTVGATSYLPTKIVLVPVSGGTSTITLTSLSTKAAIPASAFTYPAASFPKATLIDLR